MQTVDTRNVKLGRLWSDQVEEGSEEEGDLFSDEDDSDEHDDTQYVDPDEEAKACSDEEKGVQLIGGNSKKDERRETVVETGVKITLTEVEIVSNVNAMKIPATPKHIHNPNPNPNLSTVKPNSSLKVIKQANVKERQWIVAEPSLTTRGAKKITLPKRGKNYLINQNGEDIPDDNEEGVERILMKNRQPKTL